MLRGANLETARSWPAQTGVTVKGVHFVQEDSPDEIGRAIAAWMKALGRAPDGSIGRVAGAAER